MLTYRLVVIEFMQILLIERDYIYINIQLKRFQMSVIFFF